jgi:hypothetical protein
MKKREYIMALPLPDAAVFDGGYEIEEMIRMGGTSCHSIATSSSPWNDETTK